MNSEEEWELNPLRDYLDLITYGFTNPMPTAEAGPYMVTAKDVRNGAIGYSTARRTSQDAYDNLLTPKSRPILGDVLLTKDGSIGRVAVCNRSDVCINQSVALLRPNSRIRSDFLAYLLQAPEYQERMESDADGSTIKHIYITRVDKMPIAVPNLNVQQAIAEVLGALDDKIAANTRLAATCEDLVRTRFDLMRLLDDESEDQIAAVEVIHFNPKTAAPTADEPVYVDMQKLPTSHLSIDAWEYRAAKGGARFVNGDTLLARITPCLENRKTGFVDFLGEGETGLGSTEYIVMRAAEGIPAGFAYFLATSQKFRQYAIQHMVGTSGRQRVSAKDLEGFSLSRPQADDLVAFDSLAAPMFATIKGLAAESRTLATMRNTLLPQLMSGKLRVKGAEKVVAAAV